MTQRVQGVISLHKKVSQQLCGEHKDDSCDVEVVVAPTCSTTRSKMGSNPCQCFRETKSASAEVACGARTAMKQGETP